MADTIMQDTVMRDADMQDTVMQDTTTQDTTTQDTTTQDTVVIRLARKIARMKKLKKNGGKVVSEEVPYDRRGTWKSTETSYLLHLYTINHNISKSENGTIYYGEGVVATLLRDMTTESLKHTSGGSLHASDPWYPRIYTHKSIVDKIRYLIYQEDDLAAELETELNAHYGIVPDPVANQPSQFAVERRRRALAKGWKKKQKPKPKPKPTQKQKPGDIPVEEAIQEAERVLGKALVQSANQTLRLEFKKVKKPFITDKPVITDKTDA